MIEQKVIESQIARLKKERQEHLVLAERYELEISRKQGELVKLQKQISISVGNCISET